MRVQIIDWSGMSWALTDDYGSSKNHNAQYEVIDTQGTLLILSPVSPPKPPNRSLNWYLRTDGKSFNHTFAYPQQYTKPVYTKPVPEICSKCGR